MTTELVLGVLGWCTVINFGILLFWWLCLMLAQHYAAKRDPPLPPLQALPRNNLSLDEGPVAAHV